MTSSTVRLCRLEELPEGKSRGFDPLGNGYDTMLVIRRGNRLHAWRDACPHLNGAPMAWRKDEYLNAARDRIVCSAHGAQFDIVTGVCTVGPCLGQALEPLHLTVRGDTLFVDMVSRTSPVSRSSRRRRKNFRKTRSATRDTA